MWNINWFWWYDCGYADLLSRGRKLKIFLVFMQYYFAVPKIIRLNPTHSFIIKIPNKREIQKITFNHSSDIDFKDFINRYKKCAAKSYSLFSHWYYSCIR